MNKREVARLAREVAEIGAIENEIAHAVLEQYCQRALGAPAAFGGPDVARRMLSRASISEDLVDQLVHEQSTHSDDVLGPLLEASPRVLAKALEEEHPQTTALVLLQLPPKRAAQLLESLPDAKQGETVLRMANVAAVREEIIDDIAFSLRERLRNAEADEGGGGVLKTAEVLGAMPRVCSKKLLDELEADHPDHVQNLRDNLYIFDSLIDVDDRGMQELLRAVDTAQIARALDEMPEELCDRFFKNLSERAVDRLKEEMELNARVSEPEKEEARKAILQLALQLEADGKLVFREDRDDDA